MARLVSPILRGHVDLVEGFRKEPNFENTSTDYAYEAEKRTSIKLNRILKIARMVSKYSSKPIDLYSGVDIFANTPKVMELVGRRYLYTGSTNQNTSSRASLDGWFHAQVATFIEAKYLGLKVKSVGIDFKYDSRVIDNEKHSNKIKIFEEKRKMQTKVAVQPAIQLVRHLLNNSKSYFTEEVNHTRLNKIEFYKDIRFGKEPGSVRIIKFELPPKTSLRNHLHTGMLEIFSLNRGGELEIVGRDGGVSKLEKSGENVLVSVNESHIICNTSDFPVTVRAIQIIVSPAGTTELL